MPYDKAHECHYYLCQTLSKNKTQRFTYNFSARHLQLLSIKEKGGNDLWIEAVIKPFVFDDRAAVIWTAKNVTLKYYQEQELKELSRTDTLTGKLNRRAFMIELTSAINVFNSTKTDTYVLMIDIDNFKKINDNLGHHYGDHVIQHVADLCERVLRGVDILGRIGGDEFGVILRNSNAEQAKIVANRIRLNIENTPCKIDKENIMVTISLGITQLSIADHECKEVLIRSDQAMYQAKIKGKNSVETYFHKKTFP